MDKHVFVSYKHEDVDFAENLISRIKEAGFTAWQDTDKLHPGEDWRAGIDQAIKSAFALIVIMTPEAKSSEYVTYEWSFAWGAGVKVIPVVLKHTELHPRLEALQYLDFTNLSARPWGKLINALKDASTQTSSTASPSPDISPQIIEAAKLLVAAAIDQMKAVESTPGLVPESKGATATPHGINGTRETAERIRQLITPRVSEQLDRALVLWVDDRPTNNTYERHALEALGIRFDISTSTQDALQLLRQQKYDAIISDMGRPPDPRAGYTLLKKVQEMGMTIPFIIYAGSRSPEHIAEARSNGAIGTTNDPQELFEMVVTAIKNG
ncbi:MAG: TIR domain-containing protein [Chloroflexi bacterium]|nr:TIR domain-containing protein [Chloroflexota bacterium]